MEFLTIAFSTFLGATAALAVQQLTETRNARRQEETALSSLILDLAAKRAFVVAKDWDWTDGEVRRVVASVLNARELVREARLRARPRSRSLPHLQEMTRACNTFVEWDERTNAEQLKAALRELARQMAIEVRSLHDLNPRHVPDDPPGSLAL